MRFLIAGLGSVGRRHLRNLLALGERDILLYRTRRSTLPEDELAGFPVETDLARALVRRPGAVVVANPTSLHLEVAVPAAEAGCHLLIEKPVSHNLDRVSDLRRAADRGGAKVLVGFQFRFHPGLQAVRRLIEDRVIGRVVSARAHWGEFLPAWHPWEDYRGAYSARSDLGGGVLSTLCHPLDYLRWIFGEVISVSGWLGRSGDLGIEVEDIAEIGLSLGSGEHVGVHLDYLQRPPAHWLEVVGTRGSIRWDNSDGAVVWSREGEAWQRIPAPDGFERNTMFLEEMRHFISAASGREAPKCTLDDGVRVVELIEAIRRSHAERCWIDVGAGDGLRR